MNMTFEIIRAGALAATIVATASAGAVLAEPVNGSTKLMAAKFEPRQVVQVEIGEFHFRPGQVAPIHTHAAPAVGVVTKGAIIYQIEGEAPQIMREGDAFYEPVGPRILRFDNLSATDEAIFVDFNLEQEGEPFIVFETPPSEAIDRRSQPTITLDGGSLDQTEIAMSEIASGGSLELGNQVPLLGLVSEGVVELLIPGQPTRRVVAGQSFALTDASSLASIVNASSEVRARIITFLAR